MTAGTAFRRLTVPARLKLVSAAMFAGMGALHRLHVAGRLLRAMGQLTELVTEDPQLRELIVAAYAAAYADRSQFRMVVEENRIADDCRAWVGLLRAASPFPDVPVAVLAPH